jgi:cell wall-associated NlpC family hydrolase
MVLKEGTTVQLRGTAKSGWQPVYCGSTAGYVSSDYLANVTSSATSSSSSSSSSSSKTAKVTGTGGTGVRLRSAASTSASVITVVPEGATVTLRSGSTGSWTAVAYQGSNGFIYNTYLTKTTSSSSSGSGGSSSSSSSSSSGLKKGQRAKTTANVNFRYGPSTSSGIAAVAPKGTVVLITGALKTGFYPVDWDGLDGYISADYLLHTKLALSQRGGSGSSSGSTSSGSSSGSSSGGSSSGSATGTRIVDYAMQYLGYPYVWATHGPSSFDCSGFTYWVVYNTLGINITYGTSYQINYGSAVSRNSLQPGDLVFFQNTYTWGLSHVGIYIGNGKFIHAENESTGVVISELSSTYYSSRWYGARRLV